MLLQIVRATGIGIEKYLGDFVPDILFVDEIGRKIIIEIFVTHLTGPEKINKIKIVGFSAFGIDLSGLSYNTEFETVRFEVIESLGHKKDLNPPDNKKKEKSYLPALILAGLTAAASL